MRSWCNAGSPLTHFAMSNGWLHAIVYQDGGKPKECYQAYHQEKPGVA